MFIADAINYVIRKVDVAGVITTYAGGGTNSFPGNGLAATNAALGWVRAMAFDAYGNFYIADNGNSSIRRVDTNGIINTVAGTGVAGYSGDGGSATNAQLYGCSGLVFDSVGRMIIADTYNHRIRRVDTTELFQPSLGPERAVLPVTAVWLSMPI